MRWINDDAKALYEQSIAAARAIIDAANRELSGEDVSTATMIAAQRSREHIISEANVMAAPYYAIAFDLAVSYSMPDPIVIDPKMLESRPL